MFDLLANFDIVNSPDFLEVNPQFGPIFKDLKKKYPKSYSKILWAIALDNHPASIYRRLDQVPRRAIINKEYLEKDAINWEDFTSEITTFQDFCLSKPQRLLAQWEDKFEERQQFQASIPYNSSTYEMLDKMMAATDKLWKQYLTCRKDVEEEATQSVTEGGSIESISEQNLI